MPAPLGRILTAMVTPFAADGALDLDEARAVARYLVRHGSEGLVVHGTTGEAPTLSDAEKLDLVEAVAAEVGGEVPVVAGTGTYDTAHSTHLTREAVRRGADAILAVTPYYNKPPAEGIYRHFTAIAEAAGDRPVILYNIPQRVVLNMEPALLARLAGIDNVVAVKQATTDLDQARAIVEDGRLALYAGNDDLLVPFGEIGGVGGICVASHVAGEDMLELQKAIDAGDLDRARTIEAELAPLLEALSVTTNPIPVKAAMELLGFPVGPPRLPLVPATEAERAEIRGVLERRGLRARA
jgi:4-hydroxy-tetrahydrodipicolinate synthase